MKLINSVNYGRLRRPISNGVKKISSLIVALTLISMIVGCVRREAITLPEAPEVGILKPVTRPGTEAFRGGEKLTFLVKFWFIPAGQVTMEVREMRYRGYEVYSPLLTMKAARFFSFFCPAEGDIRSYLDARRLYTHRYEEHFMMGQHRHTYERLTVYDQRNRLATYDVPVKDRMGKVMRIKKKKVRIPPNTQDMLSALYYIRAQELKEGKILTINANERHKNYRIKIRVLRKEKVTVPAGTFLTWVIEPISIQRLGKEKEEEKGTGLIYLSADERKLLVLIKAKIKLGSVTVQLIDVQL